MSGNNINTEKMKQKDSVLYTLIAVVQSGISDKLPTLKFVTVYWARGLRLSPAATPSGCSN